MAVPNRQIDNVQMKALSVTSRPSLLLLSVPYNDGEIIQSSIHDDDDDDEMGFIMTGLSLCIFHNNTSIVQDQVREGEREGWMDGYIGIQLLKTQTEQMSGQYNGQA